MIALFRGGNPISMLVRMQTRSIYSHVGIIVTGTNWVVESYPGVGVRKRCLTASDMAEVDLFNVKGMTPGMWEEAIAFCESQIGMGYDWWSVARFLSKRSAKENKKWFCSELVHKAVAEAGVRLLERISSAEVSPAHIAISPLLIPVSGETPKATF